MQGQTGGTAMAKTALKKRPKKGRDRVHIPLKNLIKGLRKAAEVQLAIADILARLPEEIELPGPSEALELRNITVGGSCECEGNGEGD
jgi:hypothetical protein